MNKETQEIINRNFIIIVIWLLIITFLSIVK
jgi:hypothetical protein